MIAENHLPTFLPTFSPSVGRLPTPIDPRETQHPATGKIQRCRAAQDWADLSAGCYLLRMNVLDWCDEELWKTDMQLTEAEAAFRIHKSDLSLRPIWHQKEDRDWAHILVCFPSYVLWKTLGQICHQAGLGDEPRRVLDELSEIRLLNVILPTREGIELKEECVAGRRKIFSTANVVEKSGDRVLRRKDLRRQLGKLGYLGRSDSCRAVRAWGCVGYFVSLPGPDADRKFTGCFRTQAKHNCRDSVWAPSTLGTTSADRETPSPSSLHCRFWISFRIRL